MGPKVREIGGGPATGLANDFVNLLRGGLNTGSFGGVTAGQQFNASNPTGNTAGIAGILNDILSGGAGNIGGSLAELLQNQQSRDVNDIRARFTAGGGASLGTPAASAEALYRSEAAPQIATQVGQLQLQTLLPLLNMITGLAGKGISQRETIAQPSTFSQIAPLALAGASIALPFLAPATIPALASAGAAGSLLGQSRGVREFFGGTPNFGLNAQDPNGISSFMMPNLNLPDPNSLLLSRN